MSLVAFARMDFPWLRFVHIVLVLVVSLYFQEIRVEFQLDEGNMNAKMT